MRLTTLFALVRLGETQHVATFDEYLSGTNLERKRMAVTVLYLLNGERRRLSARQDIVDAEAAKWRAALAHGWTFTRTPAASPDGSPDGSRM